LYIIFTCPPLPHLIVGGKSLYRVGDLHLRRIMPSTFDLIFVTAGKLYLEENSQKYILKKGEFLILPPNRLHKGYKCCDEATDFFWLHFYTTGKFKYMDKPIYDKNHKQKANYQFTKEPFHISLPQHGSLTSEQQSQMAEYMNTIVQVKIDKTKPKKDFYSSTVSQLKSQQLFFSILSILCDIHEPNTKNVAEKIYEHFSLFYTESFDLKKLSDEYAFHPTHIIRCVKNKYGLSPLQLLLHIRIQKAKELLTYTNFSINKVAISVGFDDNAYFTKQFKRIIGTTPTNYRKQQQINKI
jgi:AraC-like DNA-binding protein